MRKNCYVLMIAFASLTACKKSGNTNQPPAQFHKDITIHESIKGSEQIQNTLGLYQLPDPAMVPFLMEKASHPTAA